jgi:hypothetical protein
MLGVKERSDYTRVRDKLQTYLNFLKTQNRHMILSMGVELASQGLKSELSQIGARMRSNLGAFNEIVEDEDFIEDFLVLMNLSAFKNNPLLYNQTPEARYRTPFCDGGGG